VLYREDEDPKDIDESRPTFPEAQNVEIDDIETDAYDELLMTEPMLLRDGNLSRAQVIGRKRDADGNLVGSYNSNPILNSRIYLARFPDGHIMEHSANLIAEAIYNNINDDGNEELLFKEIIAHKQSPEAITKDNVDHIKSRENENLKIRVNNMRHPLHTTQGWDMCIMWQDGSTSWHPMIDVKRSFPIQLAEYAIRSGINEEPSFAWRVRQTLKHRKSFLSSLQARYAKRTHKFGIRVPASVEEAFQINKETNTSIWHHAIQKEMQNTKQAFQFLEDDETIPIGYKWTKCHLIFDVKMDFTRKAHFVAGGHMTNPPQEITHSSVVSQDSVRIAFLLAALNDVELLSTDIGNAYLNALPREKVYTTAGP